MSRITHGTLTAATVATVNVDANTSTITVVNRTQSGEIYFTVDGSTPTVSGSNCYVCLGSKIVPAPIYTQLTAVKLISSGALNYSVVGEPL